MYIGLHFLIYIFILYSTGSICDPCTSIHLSCNNTVRKGGREREGP